MSRTSEFLDEKEAALFGVWLQNYFFVLDIYVVIIVSLHLGFPTDQILFSSPLFSSIIS